MIHLRNVCLSYGDQIVFDELNVNLSEDQRIGLVGRNGSGKSTLLKAIAAQLPLDSGSISIVGTKRVAYMPQEVVTQSNRSIREETLSAFEEMDKLINKARELEKRMEHETSNELYEQYAAVHEELGNFEPEKARAEAERMLMGLGFKNTQFDQPVNTLSVGWKMRVVLAKLLLKKADFYLFDEPTNHLDLIAKEWFLSFLRKSSFGFLIVCHERYFLDELCTYILELEFGNGTMYTGNYSNYLIQKEHNTELLQAAYTQQQKEIRQKKQTIERFRASASKAKMAKSMEKALEKVERVELPPSPKNVHFSFPPVERAGRIVLTVKDVAQHFGDKEVFKHVSFEIERDWKVALIAANGVGKTTLFNIITGSLPLQHGTITFGANVTATIFAQDQDAVLDRDRSIIENVKELCPHQLEPKIRSFLGAFLFSGDDVKKPIKVLSGGEKNRVGMVCVLLKNTNLLMLDEPTNHLDIPSKEVLLKALRSYQGTHLFVSHDRDFVNDLATHIIELTPDGAHLYHGNYDEFRQQKDELSRKTSANTQAAQAKNTDTQSDGTSAKDLFELRKKAKKLERSVEKFEEYIASAEQRFATLVYGTPEFLSTQEQLADLKRKRDTAFGEWEKALKELE